MSGMRRARVFAACAVLAAGVAALRLVGLADDVAVLALGAPAAAAPDKPPAEAAEPAAPASSDAPASRPAATSEPSDAAACAPATLADRSSLTHAELRVLASLSERREALEAREAELSARAALLDAAETRIEQRVSDLQTLRGDVERLLGQLDEAEQAQVSSLVALYTAMKAKDAARILPGLDEDVRVAVAAQMPERALSAILAAMGQDDAVTLTMLLARRHQTAEAAREQLQSSATP